MRLKCLFGFHKWFWEPIEFEFEPSSNRCWNTLNLKICTCCGKVKAFVQGKDNDGTYRTINGVKVHEYSTNKTKGW